jgi:hypothetical protein
MNEFVLTETVNAFEVTCGIDSLEHCRDVVHYKTYAKSVTYTYNSFGYRDEEWPKELTDCIWCIGDSFTVGLGQPYDETWVKLVEKQTGKRTINVSMNGASNDWISRRAQAIIDNFSPNIILIQWSYCHRRENKDTALIDEARKIHFIAAKGGREKFADMQELDKQNCIDNILKINSQFSSQVVHSFIPKFARSDDAEVIYNELKKHNINFFPEQPVVDLARDSHHYDIQTASNYANLYVSNLKMQNVI